MNKDISLEEKTGQWEFDSNWSYVRLYKWTKTLKDGSVKRYTLTGKITPDTSLPMFTVNILSDEKDYSHVVMREEFDNVMSFLVFVKQHMKEFPGLTDELLDTFVKYRREQSRIDESIKESIDLDKRSDSETLENGWTLYYDGYKVQLEKSKRNEESNSLNRWEVSINIHPSRLEEWMANYFLNIWDESQSRNEQKYGYRSNNLFDLLIELKKHMEDFPGLTMDMVEKLVNISEVAKKKAKEKYDQENNVEESTLYTSYTTPEGDISKGWAYGEWDEPDSPKIKLEYKDNSDMNDRKTYSIYIHIDYFDRQEVHHQSPFEVWISNSNDMAVKTVLRKEFKEPITFLNWMNNNLDKFPNLTMNDVNKLVKIGYDKLKKYRQENKSFNNIDINKESVEDYLSEGLENINLDETTLKDLLMAAGVLGLSTAGVYQGTQELNKMFSDKPEVTQGQDILKVPEYKNMSNIWKGIPKPQVAQKVSVDNKKAEPKKSIKKPETKKVEPKNNISKAKWSNETWKDANGKEFSLDSALNYVVDHEKFREKAYRDGFTRDKNGKKIARYSIGFGTLAPNNSPKDTITFEQAKKDMINHVKKWVLPKYKHMTFDSQNQFNSALSFTYNTGKIPPLNDQGGIDWNRFTSYNVFKGKVNSGLERRRNAEFYNAQLFDEI